jgi:serine/threonine-protein kinase
MGVVYAAQNTAIGKRVALKFIEGDVDREAALRFQREAEAASAVESAHIVHVFDAGVEQGRPFLVMELLQGESLGARLRRLGALPQHEALHVVGQALRGLARAHGAGVIHRDLKPDNLFLVDRDDDPLFLKILDFGISKMRPRAGTSQLTTLTNRGTVLGTPHYMAPEQAQGQSDFDERADLFSMGAILFECLTGRPPHANLPTYEAVIVAICTRDAPDVRDFDATIPAPLAAVVRKALSRDRNTRFSSATMFLEALRDAAPSVASLAKISAGDPSTPRPVTPALQLVDPVAPTDTNWTERGRAQHTSVPPTLPTGTDPALRGAPRPVEKKRYLAVLAAVIGVAAFVVTVAVLKSTGHTSHDVPPTASPTQGNVDITLRVETTPADAVLWVDGHRIEDHTVHGKFGSQITLKATARGHRDREELVVLDGKAFLAFALVAEPETTSSASASTEASAVPVRSVTKPVASAPPRVTSSGASGAAGAPGLQLKVTP